LPRPAVPPGWEPGLAGEWSAVLLFGQDVCGEIAD
jgi:hypothetical protein